MVGVIVISVLMGALVGIWLRGPRRRYVDNDVEREYQRHNR